MERILVVRLGAMGDVVHTLPAVGSLREAFPGAFIGWVIEERWADLLLSRKNSPAKPLVDVLHVVNTKAWRAALFSDETWREVRATIKEIRAARYEVAFDFQGLLKSAMFARLSRAPMRVGFARPKERMAAMLYTRRLDVTATHIVEQNDAMVDVFAQGVRFPANDLLPHDPVADAWCSAELQRRAVREFVLMSPGGGWGAKLWPAERFGEVARSLGVTTLVNFAPGEEELARQVVAASGGHAQAIQCSVAELIALTRRASLFVGGDSGPMHLASHVGVPVVGIFGPTDPARNGPYGGCSIVLRSESSRTSYSHSKQVEEGLLTVTVEQVAIACRTLLEKARG